MICRALKCKYYVCAFCSSTQTQMPTACWSKEHCALIQRNEVCTFYQSSRLFMLMHKSCMLTAIKLICKQNAGIFIWSAMYFMIPRTEKSHRISYISWKTLKKSVYWNSVIIFFSFYEQMEESLEVKNGTGLILVK